jgi:membrane protein DedA with SNARE-associated domain
MYAYGGATLWVGTFVFIGYHFGERWPQILGLVERNLKQASVVAGVLLLAYLLFRYLGKRQGSV